MMTPTAFWKAKTSDWRFLHDEVSGGTYAFSHLKTKSTYNGFCYSAGGNDKGFLNNIADLISTPVSLPFFWYNQLENGRDIYGPGALNLGYYNDFNYSTNRIFPASPTIPEFPSSSTPYTIVWVIENYQSTRPELGLFGSQAPGRDALFYAPRETEDLRMWCRSGVNNGTKQLRFNGGWNWGAGITKIVISTYDGSRNLSGWEIYRNDMVNPLPKVAVTDSNLLDVVWGINITTGFYFGNTSRSPNETKFKEVHFFNHVLNESERLLVKSILEQYYEFT